MIWKFLLGQLLRRLSYGRVTVHFWDGSIRHFGISGPRVEVTVRNSGVIRRIPRNASLAIGEAYMKGGLLIDSLPTFFELVAKNRLSFKISQPAWRPRNRRNRQQSQIAHHYDVGNDYYRLFLDPALLYSCAYYKTGDDTLEVAQQQKIMLILNKLLLEPGHKLLDIGCGWGHLAVAAAKIYGVEALGITLSEEQLHGARELAEREDVSDLVRFKLMNYQEVTGKFDRVVSVGMFEHVGRGQHDRYFRKVHELLVQGGISVLHTITTMRDHAIDPWVARYIFPGGHLPTVSGIEGQLEGCGFWSLHRENLWEHYAWTLGDWAREHEVHRDQIVDMYDEVFYRMRQFWLRGSEAAFRYGDLGLAQIIFSNGKPENWPRTCEFMTVN